MSDAAYCMFAGALNGEIVLCHIGSRARDVRDSVAKLHLPPPKDVNFTIGSMLPDNHRWANRSQIKTGIESHPLWALQRGDELLHPGRERLDIGWRNAKKEGWRVIPVIVQDRKAWLQRMA